MDLLDAVLARLESTRAYGYHAGAAAATEPAALSVLALLAHGRPERALPLANWLIDLQQPDGSVGTRAAESTPCWPTGWVILAWRAANEVAPDDRMTKAIDRALAAIYQLQGRLFEQLDPRSHDSMIKGWPWVEGTHAWVEPTAMNVLALKHTGHGDHVRARDGVRLLADRLLVTGGANYGNTVVLGQTLRPHVQPTGLSLLALAGEADSAGKLRRSIAYLEDELSIPTATASLCYALFGLAAQDRWPQQAPQWLDAAARRTLDRDPGAYPLALIALASLGASCPLTPRVAVTQSR